MRFTSFLKKRITDLINDRRIVVWYDPDTNFSTFVKHFTAPNCEILFPDESALKARRRADEIYRGLNESEEVAKRERSLLIYVKRSRGKSEEQRIKDPFEVYALAGAAFGDTEDQRIESLARQAMPQKSDEITRLFSEGRPDISLLDTLESTHHYPVLNRVFGTEAEGDVIALAICDAEKSKAVDENPGCLEELLRMLQNTIGFTPDSKVSRWKLQNSKVAQYVLFSEFAFDLPDKIPESLSAIAMATTPDHKTMIYVACDRMRSDRTLIETYMEVAEKIQSHLRLAEVMPQDFDPGQRDTFPFEERQWLSTAAEALISKNLPAVRAIIDGRRQSVWRNDPRRSPSWTAIERAADLLDAVRTVSAQISAAKKLTDLVSSYTTGGWSDIDKASRLFEAALTACADEQGLSPSTDLCRKLYRETAAALQNQFLEAVQVEGWPPEGVLSQTKIFDRFVADPLEQRERIAYFLVDSLRYEMGLSLAAALEQLGEVDVTHAAGVVPTVTISGMAALMPGADGMFRLVKKDASLIPAIGNRLLKVSADRMKLLTETYGDRFQDVTLDDLLASLSKISARLQQTDLLVVRTQDPDAIGENLGPWRAQRYLSEVIADIALAVRSVVAMGFSRVLITSDHGHVILPEIPIGDVVPMPSGEWLKTKRRCLLGTSFGNSPGTLVLKAGHIGIQGDVEEVCLPVGFRVFSDGASYFHGGLSLQEGIIPVIALRAQEITKPSTAKPHIEIRYRSDKFTSRVIGLKFYLQSIFPTPSRVRIEAFDGTTSKAALIGEAADCEARDEKTHEVKLDPNIETPVPVLLHPDFNGSEIEVRVSDSVTRVIWARQKLKNGILD